MKKNRKPEDYLVKCNRYGIEIHEDFHDDIEVLKALSATIDVFNSELPMFKKHVENTIRYVHDARELFLTMLKHYLGRRKSSMVVVEVKESFRTYVLSLHADSPHAISSVHIPLYRKTVEYFTSIGFPEVAKNPSAKNAPQALIAYSNGWSMIPKITDLVEVLPSNYISAMVKDNPKDTAREIFSLLMICEDGHECLTRNMELLREVFEKEENWHRGPEVWNAVIVLWSDKAFASIELDDVNQLDKKDIVKRIDEYLLNINHLPSKKVIDDVRIAFGLPIEATMTEYQIELSPNENEE